MPFYVRLRSGKTSVKNCVSVNRFCSYAIVSLHVNFIAALSLLDCAIGNISKKRARKLRKRAAHTEQDTNNNTGGTKSKQQQAKVCDWIFMTNICFQSY